MDEEYPRYEKLLPDSSLEQTNSENLRRDLRNLLADNPDYQHLEKKVNDLLAENEHLKGRIIELEPLAPRRELPKIQDFFDLVKMMGMDKHGTPRMGNPTLEDDACDLILKYRKKHNIPISENDIMRTVNEFSGVCPWRNCSDGYLYDPDSEADPDGDEDLQDRFHKYILNEKGHKELCCICHPPEIGSQQEILKRKATFLKICQSILEELFA